MLLKILKLLRVLLKHNAVGINDFIDLYDKYKGDITKVKKEETILIKTDTVINDSITCDNFIVESGTVNNNADLYIGCDTGKPQYTQGAG